jgi:hypothetical protein
VLTPDQSFLSSYFSGRFLGGVILNFWLIQNFGGFFEHLGWFKMGQNPCEGFEIHGTLICQKLRLPVKIWPYSGPFFLHEKRICLLS